jgi:TetR/AcrR family transcriptional regulator, cholesterol catabolism regulator
MATSEIAKRRAAAKADGSAQYVSRRRALIEAAAEVFKAKGLARTSIDDIARAAGVDRASLYYYVGSKKELFAEVVLEALERNIELAETISAGEDPPEQKLSRLIEGLIASYAAYHPHLYVFVQEDPLQLGAGRAGRPIAELQRRFDRALIGIVEEGMAQGVFRSDLSPRIVAYGVIGMVNWTHRWFDPNGPVGPSEVGRAFAGLAADGVRAPSSST